jgi:lantibiotic modifying enzyme
MAVRRIERRRNSHLMLGLAGIGYFFLRLHDRQNTPSVLLVKPE